MILLFISLMLYLLQNFSNKQYSRTVNRGGFSVILVQNCLCLLSAVVFMAITGGIQLMPIGIMLMAVLFGILYLLTVFLLLAAFSLGPMGNSSLICNLGMFISAGYGVLRFGDEFTLSIGVGTALMLAAVIISKPKNQNEAKGGMTWFAVALGSGLSNGAVASVKRDAVSLYFGNTQTFLFWGFLFAAMSAIFLLLFKSTGRAELKNVLKRPQLAAYGILAGIGTAGANLFQMLSLKRLSSAVVFPLTSGFLVVALWFASYLFYHETKLTWKNSLAMIFCVLAIIILNL